MTEYKKTGNPDPEERKRVAVKYAKNVILNCISQEIENLKKRGVDVQHVYISTPFSRIEQEGIYPDLYERVFSPSVSIDYK
jgi:hypothetical protein